MEDCIFCKITKKEVPSEVIYEDADFLAIVDIQPSNFGHSLIIPKEHSSNIYDMTDATLSKLGPVIKKIATAVKSAVNAEGVNVIMNNEQAAGQVIFHQHTHIVPRYRDDGHKWWPTKEYNGPDHIKEIGEKIREAIL